MSRPAVAPQKPLHPLVNQLLDASRGVKRISIACDANISTSAVSAIFLGQRRPSIVKLSALAKALGYELTLVKRKGRVG